MSDSETASPESETELSRVPRASLSITILGDEDYRLLVKRKGGLAAFGVFVAIVLAGRERLQEGKARRIPETEALLFDNRKSHVREMLGINPKQLDSCLRLVLRVADETKSEPWVYLDGNDHLVIRSFFKFNTNTGWGGPRDGAGRPPSDIQDESNLNPSRIRSGSGSGSGLLNTPPNPLKGDVCVDPSVTTLRIESMREREAKKRAEESARDLEYARIADERRKARGQ